MKKIFSMIVLMVILLIVLAGCTSSTIVQVDTPAANAKAGTPAPSEQIKVPGFSININVPGPNPLMDKAGVHGIASTLIGIWHGIISPVTLVVSFINPKIQMYEVHNDGSKYNLGFLVGVAIVFLILGIIGGLRRR